MATSMWKYVSTLLPSQRPTSTSTSTQPDLEKSPAPAIPIPQVQDPLPLPPRLAKFQNLIGICSPTVFGTLPTGGPHSRPAPNEGIYKRTVDEESKVRFQYTLSNYTVNGAGLLQIIVAAAVTALGAANGPRGAVTVLGAANTIMAGLLTYLKGQGLPNRLEQYLHLLRTLREHIEEREREFLEPACALDVDEEILRVAKMYQEVRQTAADNSPGTVLPPRGAITSLLKKPDVLRGDVSAPRGDKKPSEMLMTGLQDLASFGHHHQGPQGQQGQHGVAGGAGGLEEKEEEALRAVRGTAAAAEKDLAAKAGAEMAHLEGMAKDALGRLGGGSESSEEKR